MLVIMYETREPIVETTDCLVVSRELSLKLGFVVNCNSSKNGQEEYRYIQEIKNFLHKTFQLRYGLGFFK